MLRRRLTVLNHPNPETFDINDSDEFRSCVLWLEDQKIRQYKIEDREGLRSSDAEVWGRAFAGYLGDVGAPTSVAAASATPLERLTWLTSLAVRLEYGDNVNDINVKIAERGERQTSAPSVVQTNPLDNLDFSSDAFASGVARVATLGSIGPHHDPRVRLSALATVVKAAPHPPPSGPNLESVETPRDVLELLFLNELRALQTTINETLVAVQKITANPKTDTALGKVGF